MKLISTSSYQPIQHSFHKEKNKNKKDNSKRKKINTHKAIQLKHTMTHSCTSIILNDNKSTWLRDNKNENWKCNAFQFS